MTLPREIPSDATPARCPYCDDAFPDEELLALHVGLDHGDVCTPEERERFEEAFEAETEDVRLFQLQAVGMLVLLYFGLLITYAVAT